MLSPDQLLPALSLLTFALPASRAIAVPQPGRIATLATRVPDASTFFVPGHGFDHPIFNSTGSAAAGASSLAERDSIDCYKGGSDPFVSTISGAWQHACDQIGAVYI